MIIRQQYWETDHLILYYKQYNQDQSLPLIPGSSMILLKSSASIPCVTAYPELHHVKCANVTFLSPSMETIKKNFLN